jgi:threonine aldolase
MYEAEVGDEQKGTDPTVNQLLENVCDLLNKEVALFFPTGTVCNLISLKVHTRPSQLVLAEYMSHIIRAEAGGMGLCSGAMLEPIISERGIFTIADVDQALARVSAAPTPYSPVPKLLCFEQTHNFGGGSVWSLAELSEVANRARELELATHMDGARLLNAVVATGTPASKFSDCVDSVWVDFTKGLGAPMGAVLAGSHDFMVEAKRYKHVFGAALRQAGIVAAACLYSLRHHIPRLSDDHDKARRLAQGLSDLASIEVHNPTPETNMVFFSTKNINLSSKKLLKMLISKGIQMGLVGNRIRAVTHIDISMDDIESAISTVKQIVEYDAR